MTLFHAIILGLVQGLAEFLPISSSGHLAILEQILQVENAGMVFDVMLHFGTLVAIFVAFWADIKMLFVEGICIVRDAVINVIIFFKNFNKTVREKEPYRKMDQFIIQEVCNARNCIDNTDRYSRNSA